MYRNMWYSLNMPSMRTTHKCDHVRKFLHISTTEDHPLRSELHMEQVGSVTYDLKSELHMHQMGSVMDDHPLKNELHMHQVGSVMDDHSLKSDLHMHKLGSVMDGRERKKKKTHQANIKAWENQRGCRLDGACLLLHLTRVHIGLSRKCRNQRLKDKRANQEPHQPSRVCHKHWWISHL